MRSLSLLSSKPGNCKIAFQMLEIILTQSENPLVRPVLGYDLWNLPAKSGGGYEKAWSTLVRLISYQEEIIVSTSKLKEILDYFTEKGMRVHRGRMEHVLRGLYLDALVMMFNRLGGERILEEVLRMRKNEG